MLYDAWQGWYWLVGESDGYWGGSLSGPAHFPFVATFWFTCLVLFVWTTARDKGTTRAAEQPTEEPFVG